MAKTKQQVVETFDEETQEHETETATVEVAPGAEVTVEVTPESYTVTFTIAVIDRLYGFGEMRRHADHVVRTLLSL